MGRAGAIPEPFDAPSLVASEPVVVGLAADVVIAAGYCDFADDFLDVPQHGQLVLRAPLELPLDRHWDR